MNPVKFVRARCLYSTHRDFIPGEVYRLNYKFSGRFADYYESYNELYAVRCKDSGVIYIESPNRVFAVFEVIQECTA